MLRTLITLVLASNAFAQLNPAPRPFNVGIAGDQVLRVEGRRALFVAVEADQGADLNGDGDQLDHVLTVYDADADDLLITGLAVARFGPNFDLDGDLLALAVDEGDQGSDLNLDGDPWDRVLHLVDLTTGDVTMTPFDVYGQVAVAGGRVACGVNEDGVDRNGDGDPNDVVVHLVEADGSARNLGWASYEWNFDGATVAVPVDEIQQGDTDLNQDGDAWDTVLHLFDVATRTSTNLAVSISSDRARFPFEASRLLYVVSEGANGGVDLNGDGDGNDEVLHVHVGGASTNLGVSVASALWVDGPHVLFAVSEAGEGGLDRNGDGDTADRVLATVTLPAGTVENLGLVTPASEPWVGLSNGWVACDVIEDEQGAGDLNGDGDTADVVLHVVEIGGSARNTGLASGSGSPARLGDGFCATTVSEFYQGEDLNQDGDLQDVVLHVHDLASGVNRNLRLHSSLYLANGGRLAFAVTENSQGQDLNRDGDQNDLVELLYLPRQDWLINLALATWSSRDIDARLYAFGVREDWQGGVDLNGDGDTDDEVLHVLR